MSNQHPQRDINTVPEIAALDLCVVTVTGEDSALVSLRHRIVLIDDLGAYSITGEHKTFEVTGELEDKINGEKDAGFPGWSDIFDYIEANRVTLFPQPAKPEPVVLGTLSIPAVWDTLVAEPFEEGENHDLWLATDDPEADAIEVKSAVGIEVAVDCLTAYTEDAREIEVVLSNGWKAILTLSSGQNGYWADFNVFAAGKPDSLIYETADTDAEIPESFTFTVEGQAYTVNVQRLVAAS